MISAQFKTHFRGEAPAMLRLALPLIGAQITFVGFGVLDTLMAGRLGGRELAAIAVGSNVWVQIFIFFMGICVACSPIVAHRAGAGEAPARTGLFVRQALAAAVVMGLLWIFLLRQIAWPAISLLGLTPETADLAYRYVLAESWSGVLFTLCFTLRNCAEGLGLSRVVLFAGLCGLAAKALFNVLLVHGKAGLPAFGTVGFGYATVGAAFVILLAYLAQYALVSQLRAFELWRRAPLRLSGEVLELFKLGLPIGMILFAEVAFFGCTALLMARFGDAVVAAHQVAINFASITFMVPLGIGMAAAVRVGHAAGAGHAAEALARGKVAMSLALCFALFSATLMAFFPELVISFYTRVPDVAKQAETFLRLAAIFQLFDCLQAAANGALRGIKDTNKPMFITIVAYWGVGMPASYVLAFTLNFGPNALWWGFVLALAVAAISLTWRFVLRAGRGIHRPDRAAGAVV